jgi:hypothetical protein
VSYCQDGLHPPKILTWRDPLTACLLDLKRSEKLAAGISDYMFARTLSAMSDWQLQIEPFAWGAPFAWGNDPFWFDHAADAPDHPADYDFVVAVAYPDAAAMDRMRQTVGSDAANIWETSWKGSTGFTADQLESLFGKPAKIVTCPGGSGLTRTRSPDTAIWIYRDVFRISGAAVLHRPSSPA